MPWRLIIGIVIFAVFLVFIAFNVNNSCNISFGFGKEIPDVPVFITIFVSFVFGLICAFPLVIFIKNKNDRLKKENQNELEEIQAENNSDADEKIKKDAAEARKRFFNKRRAGSNE